MKKNKKSLHKQIIVLLIIAIVVPITIVSAINFYVLNLSINSNFKQMATSNLGNVIDIISDISKNNKESIEMLSEDPNARSILEAQENKLWLRKFLDSFKKSHEGVASVYMATINKEMIMVPDNSIPKDFDPSSREWYKKAMENQGKVIITNPYVDISNEKQYDVTFAKTVKDASGKIVGVIAIDITLDQLSNKVSSITMGKSGYAVVIDSNGVIIAHKSIDKIGKTTKEDKSIEDIVTAKSSTFEQEINSMKYLVFKQKEEATGYTVAALIPKKELTSEIIRVTIINIGVALTSLILVIFIGNRFTKVKITNPIKKVVDALGYIGEGDFTVKVESGRNTSEEVEMIISAINNTANGVLEILKNVSKASESLKENSQSLLAITEESSVVGDEVARAVQQIADGSVHQSEKLNESVAISEKLGNEVEESLKDSSEMMKASKIVKVASDEGAELINSLTEVFKETYAANLEVVEKVKELEEKSNHIGAITDVIKSITEQTNLLALNASIEAARAGEAGRGFAVVAEEVRKLAEQSSSSALEIEKVISEVKISVNGVFEKLKHSTELNDKTSENVQVTSKSFENIKQFISILENNIEKVSKCLTEIKADKDEVIVNISEISAVAQEAAATSEEVSASSEEQSSGLQEIVSSAEKLNVLSEELKSIISKFKI